MHSFQKVLLMQGPAEFLVRLIGNRLGSMIPGPGRGSACVDAQVLGGWCLLHSLKGV